MNSRRAVGPVGVKKKKARPKIIATNNVFLSVEAFYEIRQSSINLDHFKQEGMLACEENATWTPEARYFATFEVETYSQSVRLELGYEQSLVLTGIVIIKTSTRNTLHNFSPFLAFNTIILITLTSNLHWLHSKHLRHHAGSMIALIPFSFHNFAAFQNLVAFSILYSASFTGSVLWGNVSKYK